LLNQTMNANFAHIQESVWVWVLKIPQKKVHISNQQRQKEDIGFDTKRHFYHPNSNRYYVYFGKKFAEQKIGLAYKRKLEGPVTNEDWEAVKQEFFKLVGENNPDLFVLRE
jgi:hypothetical protein